LNRGSRMDKKQVRDLFKRGLGGSNLSDPTLDIFLQSGQDLLDELVEGQTESRLNKDIIAGDYIVLFPYRLKTVTTVELRKTTDSLYLAQLARVDFKGLRKQYPNPWLTSLRDTPLYYAVARWMDDPTYLTSNDYPLTTPVIDPIKGVDFRAIVLAPVPSEAFTVDIWCTTYSAPLSVDTSETFWTRHYPLLLVSAASLHMEQFLRNASSAQDLLKYITTQVNLINHQFIEDEMEGRPNYIGDRV
jgi:hypothetical protein